MRGTQPLSWTLSPDGGGAEVETAISFGFKRISALSLWGCEAPKIFLQLSNPLDPISSDLIHNENPRDR